MISPVPVSRTVYVKPVRFAKSRACPSRSDRFSSGVMGLGQDRPCMPGVDLMWSMLDVQAA
jgi:hypothetical protein